MKNRISKKAKKDKPPIDLRKQQVMCLKIAASMGSAAKELKLQVSGQFAIEGDGERLIGVYSCFVNGDVMTWFLHNGYYSLTALVNQKRFVTVFPAHEAEAFQAELTKLSQEMGK